MPQQESQAAEKLAKLEYYFMNDSTAMVLNGNKSLKIESAPSIADSYSGTQKGSEAALMAGLTYLHTGEFQKALDYLDMAKMGDGLRKCASVRRRYRSDLRIAATAAGDPAIQKKASAAIGSPIGHNPLI